MGATYNPTKSQPANIGITLWLNFVMYDSPPSEVMDLLFDDSVGIG